LSRQGNIFHAPDWFKAGLPSVPLDGELWLARKAFQRTVSIVRRQDHSDHWREIRYLVFDMPAVSAAFEERLAELRDCLATHGPQFAALHPQELCHSVDHLRGELARVTALGGEGLMLRQPGSRYETGRSPTLLKVKTFQDAEARVVEHLPGTGRHKGRLGALAVELPDGTNFSIGTGFSDAERESPPPVGSTVTFRYQELSDRGVPRFPSFVRITCDAHGSKPSKSSR
jgi:DNA ligase-1